MGDLFGSKPQYVQPQPDPALAELNAQSEAQNIAAVQAQTKIDSAKLMQTYGMAAAVGGTPASLSSGVAAPFSMNGLTALIANGAR